MRIKNKPAKSTLTILRQLCQLIPGHLTIKLARQHQIEFRSFNPWSRVVAMVYAQLSRAMSLTTFATAWLFVRTRCGKSAEQQFPVRTVCRTAIANGTLGWPKICTGQWPSIFVSPHKGFASGHGAKNYAYRFRRPIHLADATTIQLVANCMDWAKHRRRKAAVKCHLRLDLQRFCPAL